MKTIDLFCASPASTAICSSMDQRSTIRHFTKPISRHKSNLPPLPCPSQLPFDHPRTSDHKNRKSTSSTKQINFHKESSAEENDHVSPPGSSRYLLRDTPFSQELSDSDIVQALFPSQKMRPGYLSPNDSPSSKYSPRLRDTHHVKTRHLSPKSSQRLWDWDHARTLVHRQNIDSSTDSPLSKSSSTRSRSRDKVVELMVSIHCKGCEGKVRKHISKMEGVTSFSIDLVTKKVTVKGNVTPLGVLTSISRVKKAQFWPSPTPSWSLPMVGLGY